MIAQPICVGDQIYIFRNFRIMQKSRDQSRNLLGDHLSYHDA